jgi:hypothetical protein
MPGTKKPIYLDEPKPKWLDRLAIALVVVIAMAAAAVFFYKGWQQDQKNSSTGDACDLLMIAFDEAQMAPGWYESAGKVLQSCGKKVDQETITGKVCFANRWNGYESEMCTEFEKTR